MIVTYVLISVLVFAYSIVIVSVVRSRRKEKSEWEKYWDNVFERNKNL